MKSRKEQHREEKHNSIGLSVMLMAMSGAAAVMNGNAAYITLNRHSAAYAIVKGEFNSHASWGARARVRFEYEGEQGELRSAGLRVPDDISVIGFDDIAISKNYIPALSTVSLHLRQLGVEAGNMIEAQFSGARQVHNTQVRCDLIIREST